MPENPGRRRDLEVPDGSLSALSHPATRRTMRVLTPSPFRVYVDSTATGLWMAGDPQPRRVVSVPGGARPLGVAMSTADNRNP
ncbi:hypothetical protein ACWD1Y_31360 [Streptomyces sp. NPDC002814]